MFFRQLKNIVYFSGRNSLIHKTNFNCRTST